MFVSKEPGDQHLQVLSKGPGVKPSTSHLRDAALSQSHGAANPLHVLISQYSVK